MIANRRRMAIRDFLLITVSGAVIVLALWPPAPPRQTVLVRDSVGMMQRYSLAVDDPKLARLQAELDRRATSLPHAGLALAKWRVEMADFYAEQTKPRSKVDDDILRVSFTDSPPSDIPSPQAALWEAQHEQWVRFGEGARRDLTDIQSQIDGLQAMADSAPIQFGDEIPGKLPNHAFLTALLAGSLLALLFAGWKGLCPEVALQVPRAGDPVEPTLSNGESRELQFAIPAGWVRVHQPAMVLVRRITMLLIVAAALGLVTRL